MQWTPRASFSFIRYFKDKLATSRLYWFYPNFSLLVSRCRTRHIVEVTQELGSKKLTWEISKSGKTRYWKTILSMYSNILNYN